MTTGPDRVAAFFLTPEFASGPAGRLGWHDEIMREGDADIQLCAGAILR
jgi:hypothetical protein